jgi:hypothetical protein
MSPPSITVASSFAMEEVAGECIRVQRADTIFERPSPRHARLVDERLVDLSLARGWIERCDITHRESCQRIPLRRLGEPTTFRFRLIDVDDGCTVSTELNHGYEYVALSYIWASTNTQSMLNRSTSGPGANLAHCSAPVGSFQRLSRMQLQSRAYLVRGIFGLMRFAFFKIPT